MGEVVSKTDAPGELLLPRVRRGCVGEFKKLPFGLRALPK